MANRLGGRKEVVDAPVVELMKYMELEIDEIEQELEQEKAKMYINYLANIFSQPVQGKPSNEFKKAKKEFEEMLMPEQTKEANRVSYEWDFDPSDYIEE